MNDLGRLWQAWKMYPQERVFEQDAVKFMSLLVEALVKGDDKFLRELAAEIQRQNSRIQKAKSDSIYDPEALPWYPETALKKIRYAYRAVVFEKYLKGRRTLNSEILDEVFWHDAKEKTIDLFGLQLTPRQWRRLRLEAGLSRPICEDRPRGKAKKSGHRK